MLVEVPDPIASEADLNALFPAPATTSIRKVTPRLTRSYRKMIEASPFFVIATIGPRGIDCSPRGDVAGFVRIIDDSLFYYLSGAETTASIPCGTSSAIHGPRCSFSFLV